MSGRKAESREEDTIQAKKLGGGIKPLNYWATLPFTSAMVKWPTDSNSKLKAGARQFETVEGGKHATCCRT